VKKNAEKEKKVKERAKNLRFLKISQIPEFLRENFLLQYILHLHPLTPCYPLEDLPHLEVPQEIHPLLSVYSNSLCNHEGPQ